MPSMQAPAARVSVMKSYSEKPKQLLAGGFQNKVKRRADGSVESGRQRREVVEKFPATSQILG